MRKIKEIFRLHFTAGLSQRNIARSTSVSRKTVADYLARAQVAGLNWPQIQQMSEAELNAKLFPQPSFQRGRPRPDFNRIHRELRQKGVTLRLLWQEYQETHPDGYQFSQFCDLYRRWRGRIDLALRQNYQAGEKLFVDYAGQTVEVVDGKSGEVRPAHIFVAALGASSYTYAEASLKQDLPSWISAHCRAFEYFGGVPKIVVPDNTKTAVRSACFYEPELNPTYRALAEHYQVAVVPARPRKPRDKAKVEAAVLLVERWILAALRKCTFFSLGELNQAISELLQQLNNRPFQKLDVSRRQLFEQTDRPVLGPLPATRFQFTQWKKARVNIDYHVELDRHYYSVPYSLIRQKVELRYSSTLVEIFLKGERVASHRRSYRPGAHTTDPNHRPQCHRRYLEWSPSRLISWAEKTGPQTAAVVSAILESRRYPEQGYRSCLGLLRLAKTFGSDRLEAACHRGLQMNAVSYKSVKSILKNGLDRQTLLLQPETTTVRHTNIRGADYFQPKEDSNVH